MSLPGNPAGSLPYIARRAPASPAAAKTIARNSTPLPRITDEMNLSSHRPRRCRETPMNHRKKMPAKGRRASAHSSSEVPLASHAPPSSAPPAVDCTIVTHAPNSTPNSIPATEPAVSVRAWCSALRVNAKPGCSDRVPSVMTLASPS